MMKKITLILTSAVISICAQAQSFTATYTFDSVKATSGFIDPTPVPTAAGITFGSFSATGTSANTSTANRFSFPGWPLGATASNDLYTSLTGTVNTAEYYEVTITPDANFTIDFDSIKFTAQRSGTGIRTYAVRSSLDGYATNLAASINPASTKLSIESGDIFFWNLDATTTAQQGSKITLGGASFTGLSNAITFRFYGWNAEQTGGSFSIDNVLFTGLANLGSSVTNLSSQTSASIYPNPSSNGIFTVNLGSVSTKTIVTVYNIIGKIILEKEINSSTKQLIDLSSEAAGCYFINIKNDKENSTKKVSVYK